MCILLCLSHLRFDLWWGNIARMVNIFGKEDVRGKRGDRGPIGPMGSTGVKGPQGKRGESGKKGDLGPIGPKGSTGAGGPQGERGDPGTSGIVDLYNWLPSTVLENFQIDSEECCFIIRKSGDDIKKDKKGNIVSWKSKSNASLLDGYVRFKRMAVITAQSQSFKSVTYFPDGRGYLTLEKSLFEVKNVTLTSTYSFACVTFKVIGNDADQYIVSNWQPDQEQFVFREISVSKDEIRIHGCVNGEKDYFTIAHDTTIWTTIFVEWSENSGNRGTFDINNGEKKGTFIVKPSTELLPSAAYIGGRSDNSHYFNGHISAVEWCSILEPEKDCCFPNYLKKLIMQSQYIDDDNNEGSPPVKLFKA